MPDEQLIKQCYEDYQSNLHYYQKMQKYYQGESDVILEKSDIDRANVSKIEHNYIKFFIKKECDFILANDVTYINNDTDNNLEEIINMQFAHWKKDHDKKIFRRSLLYGKSFELYYVNKNAEFCSRIISPLNGYPYFEDEELKLFLHIFKKTLDKNTVYMDVYDENNIYNYKNGELISTSPHIFNGVPVGICQVDDNEKDTLFNDLKCIQDGYTMNISDGVHELSQYRNAYLKMINLDFDDEDLSKMKRQGILKMKGKDVDIDWLIKNINGDFFMSILKELKDNLYTLSGHINHAEAIPSNNSSLAVQARELAMRNKTKSNIAAMHNLIMDRIRYLFRYIYVLQNKQYNYKLANVRFTE